MEKHAVHHRSIEADGINIFYREAGAEKAPVVKLYDTGHFALETHCEEIGDDIFEFMNDLYQ
jgi:hypothetical protein